MIEALDKAIVQMNNVIWTYVVISLLVVTGVYFTFRLKFVQFRKIGEMFRLLFEGVRKSNGVSSFQAFCISTASRVGVGNIAGVAMAIALGGPGAVFWMWVICMFGGALAFVESTLAQVYKVRNGSTFRGGPAYYIEKGLGLRWMGILFAVIITLCYGLVFNSVQANTITVLFEDTYGVNRAMLGIAVAVALGIIIFGGVKRVAKAAELIVPPMALGYILLAIYVILSNIELLPGIFKQIFEGAFGLQEAVAGGMGAAVMQGVKRGLFSNEAGMGSAPNAAATADVSHPAKQGFIQALSVFIDTLLVCSSSAFFVLISGAYKNADQAGIEIASRALGTELGAWGQHFLAIAIFLFAFTTLIGNYYFGEANIEFIKSSKTWINLYRVAVIGMVLWGAMTQVSIVWNMADLFMSFMVVTNLIAIVLLGRIASAVLQDYLVQKKAGKNPVFKASNIPGLKNAECWEEPEQMSKAS